MVKGTTSAGFEFELDEKVLDNMELVDAVAESEENPTAVSQVCLLLLGKAQRRRLYDHLRTPDGRVPVEQVTASVVEIFNVCGRPGKN